MMNWKKYIYNIHIDNFDVMFTQHSQEINKTSLMITYS